MNRVLTTVLLVCAGCSAPSDMTDCGSSHLTAIPPSLDFGRGTIASAPVRKSISFKNVGACNASVVSIGFDQDGGAAATLAAVPTLPAIVVPGGTFSFDVKFTYESGLRRATTYAITADGARWDVPFSGLGSEF